MTKSELIQYLENGGSFTIKAEGHQFSTLVTLAEAVAKNRGVLTITDTNRLYHSEMMTLCRTAPGQVIFPDKILER